MIKKIAFLLFVVLTVPLNVFAFTDSNGHMNESAIDYLQVNKVVEGYSDGGFHPNQPINRAEFLKIVSESLSMVVDGANFCFPDVADEWFASYICSAKRAGIVSGYPDGKFMPGNYINFAEALKIVLEAYQAPVNEVDSPVWYERYVTFMQENGLLTLINQEVAHEITRGEMAQLIYNLDHFLQRTAGTKIDAINDNLPPVSTLPYVCIIDHSLQIGAYRQEIPKGDSATEVLNGLDNMEIINDVNASECKSQVLAKGYRFSKVFFTTKDFAVVCTEPCSIENEAYFEAAFEGARLGISTLESKVGFLPKDKMEIHLGMDGDCFAQGYGDHPTGYAGTITQNNHSLICNSNHYWYEDSQGTTWQRDLNYERSLEAQTLTIHEPIHLLFLDYPIGANWFNSNPAPEYKIQEAFCKGVSLTAVGLASGYGDKWFEAGGLSINNPPAEDNPEIFNFFTYSLSKRFGFNESTDTLEFFKLYKEKPYDPSVSGNRRVKLILDEILGTDTTASFNDVGIDL